jgi:hypothetical protein
MNSHLIRREYLFNAWKIITRRFDSLVMNYWNVKALICFSLNLSIA